MPRWPLAMPSVTLAEVNSKGVPPASRTPVFTNWAWSCSGMLQGEDSLQVVAMPISGLSRSSGARPVPSIIARIGAFSGPSVT